VDSEFLNLPLAQAQAQFFWHDVSVFPNETWLVVAGTADVIIARK
jgi:hypothetical protein